MSLFNQLGNAPQQQAQAVMDQQQRTVQAPPAQMQTPSQSSKRFMIEDLALDDDEVALMAIVKVGNAYFDGREFHALCCDGDTWRCSCEACNLGGAVVGCQVEGSCSSELVAHLEAMIVLIEEDAVRAVGEVGVVGALDACDGPIDELNGDGTCRCCAEFGNGSDGAGEGEGGGSNVADVVVGIDGNGLDGAVLADDEGCSVL